MKKTVATLALASLHYLGHAMIIDNFTVPYSKTLTSGTFVDYQTDASLLSGERDVETEILSNSGGGAAHLAIGGGQISLRNDAGVGSMVRLEYDGVGDEINNTGPGRSLIHAFNPNNPFPLGSSRVVVHVDRLVGAPMEVAVHLYRDGVRTFQYGRNPSPGENFTINFNIFPANLRECDSMQVYFYLPLPLQEIVVSKVEIVPEGNSALFLLTGGIVLGYRKHLRSKRQ
ncbi:MAG TPA: hypothetical protein PKA27_03320 [Fimbriimonadaceae bacterium]|nr:hypothetical protein [Fimbriimonadaceae bacterium]